MKVVGMDFRIRPVRLCKAPMMYFTRNRCTQLQVALHTLMSWVPFC